VIVGMTGMSAPFVRMVRGLAEYAAAHPGEEIWVQHGKAELPPILSGAPFVQRDVMLERLRAADVVVTHAGCGSLFDAMSLGQTPVVVPRLERFGEHVNDHQLELLDALSAEGRILAVRDIAELPRAIDEARRRPSTHTDTTRRGALAAELAGDLVRLSRATPRERASRERVFAVLRAVTAWVPRHPHRW
jgi:beta-1,4-N-acetylglucosaminyltransferase